MGALLSIGIVANRAGVTPDTIRYYERSGLLPTPTRTRAGYRQYGDGIVQRLTLIRNAQQFGFSLREIASFLGVREKGGKPCYDVRRAAEQMLAQVDRQIAELLRTRNQMKKTLRLWDNTLAATPDHQPAYLLETLSPLNDGRAKDRAALKNRSQRTASTGR